MDWPKALHLLRLAVNELRTCLLSGGASRRMGSDKALLPHPEGDCWLARTLSLLAELQRPLTLLSHHDAHLRLAAGLVSGLRVEVELLREPPPRDGPLLALQRLMDHHPDQSLLLCAVDMPWMTITTLEAIIAGPDPAQPGSGPAVVGFDGDRVHPLPGLYPNDQGRLRALRRFRASGGRSLLGWLHAVGFSAIPLPPETLRNANRPEDLASLQPAPGGP